MEGAIITDVGSIKKSIIDRLPYKHKVILLEEILCEYITTGKDPVDKYDNEIFKFFKDNFIRKSENDEYSIYDKIVKSRCA